MPVSVTVSMSGLDQVLEQIAGLEHRAAQPVPALETIADLLEAHVQLQFATQGGRGARPWTPLAVTTVNARLRRWGYYRTPPTAGVGPTGPILQWTGRLRRGFRRGSAEHVRRVSAQGLSWGTDVPYAGYHQSLLPRTRLPRRPPVDFRDEFQRREIAFQTLRLWLQGVPIGAIRTTMAARLGVTLA